MGVGDLGGDLGLGGVLSTLLLSVGDGLSAGGEGEDDIAKSWQVIEEVIYR